MEEGRGGLLSAGGILSIIVGVFQITVGGLMLLLTTGGIIPFSLMPLSGPVGLSTASSMYAAPLWWIMMGGVLIALGIVAILGGVSAVRRKSFGLALAGAICSLPSVSFGILAIIFVSLAKREF
jgi:hypothetical protein